MDKESVVPASILRSEPVLNFDKLEALWKRLSSIGSASRLFAFRDWNLSSLDLSGQDFSEVVFPRGCVFSGANLQGAIFRDAVLNSAVFVGSVLSNVTFSGANLSGADLSTAKLSSLELEGVCLAYVKLVRADLGGSRLVDVDLRYSACRQANFSYARFRRVDFYCSDLRDVDLSFAQIHESDLAGAHLTGAVVGGLNIGELKPINRDLRPRCSNCGGPTYVAAVDEERVRGRAIDQEGKMQCGYCHTQISRGDLMVKVIGADGSEVAKVIKEVRQMQQDGVVINVSGGQIGNMNLGTIVGDIEVHLTSLRNQGGEEIASLLKQLTEGVLTSESLKDSEKRDATQQIEELARQADLPESRRKTGVIRSVISTLDSALSSLEHLKPLWGRVVQLLGDYFGFASGSV